MISQLGMVIELIHAVRVFMEIVAFQINIFYTVLKHIVYMIDELLVVFLESGGLLVGLFEYLLVLLVAPEQAQLRGCQLPLSEKCTHLVADESVHNFLFVEVLRLVVVLHLRLKVAYEYLHGLGLRISHDRLGIVIDIGYVFLGSFQVMLVSISVIFFSRSSL